jgi:murein DD-endopeptidase MepM/ murein hydrolase activator NlpD
VKTAGLLARALVAASIATAATAAATAMAGGAYGAPVLPATVRPGDVFVLRPAAGPAAPEAARFREKVYPPLSAPGEPGLFFLLGVDLEAAPGSEQIVVVRTGGAEERLAVRVVKRSFPEERLTLPPAMVTPPPELEERIAREQALAADIYRTAGVAKLWDRGFAPALAQKAAGNFGRRRILNGIPRSPHAGQDYTAPAGTPVRAIAGGTVRFAGDLYYSGLTAFVDHGAGLVSVYMHLEKLLAAAGESVAAGQVIGRVGSTGRATGPHLHLGVRLFEQRVDPERLWDLFGGPAPSSHLNSARETGISHP